MVLLFIAKENQSIRMHRFHARLSYAVVQVSHWLMECQVVVSDALAWHVSVLLKWSAKSYVLRSDGSARGSSSPPLEDKADEWEGKRHEDRLQRFDSNED